MDPNPKHIYNQGKTSMIKITLPDGKIKEFEPGISSLDIVKSIGPGLAKAALAATIDGKPVDLSLKIDRDAQFSALTFDSEQGKEVLRHSTSHLMAQAVTELFPNTKAAIGPAIEDGYYYDFDRPEPFSSDDLAAIEKKMSELAAKDIPIVRQEMPREQALEHFQSKGEPYKVELITSLPAGEVISFYKQGEFIDLLFSDHRSENGTDTRLQGRRTPFHRREE